MLWSAEIANVEVVKDFRKPPREQHYFTSEKCCKENMTERVNESLVHGKPGVTEPT